MLSLISFLPLCEPFLANDNAESCGSFSFLCLSLSFFGFVRGRYIYGFHTSVFVAVKNIVSGFSPHLLPAGIYV